MSKILIIDDEPMMTELLEQHLADSGYGTMTANSAAEAMKLLPRNPDLIILDINMPDMDGLTFCKNIREHVSCPILFLTARVTEQDKIMGQVFDKERIYELVWGYDAEGNADVVKEHIRKIRTKLTAVCGRDYIDTVWGVGYKWVH